MSQFFRRGVDLTPEDDEIFQRNVERYKRWLMKQGLERIARVDEVELGRFVADYQERSSS